MNKIQRQVANLKADVPYSIAVDGGISCNSKIYFLVSPSIVGKKINFHFKDADGRQIYLPIQLMNETTSLRYHYTEMRELNSQLFFESVELLSYEDLQVEIWTPEA